MNEALASSARRNPKRHPQLCYCLILLSLIAAPAFAKERAFRVFNLSNGFPVSSLAGFAQDTNGFFWFATAAGLYRFNEEEFRHWAKDKIGAPFLGVYAGLNGDSHFNNPCRF